MKPATKITDEIRDNAVRIYNDGNSIRETAQSLKISEGAVQSILVLRNVPRRPSGEAIKMSFQKIKLNGRSRKQ